jgi:hypothetical protein
MACPLVLSGRVSAKDLRGDMAVTNSQILI